MTITDPTAVESNVGKSKDKGSKKSLGAIWVAAMMGATSLLGFSSYEIGQSSRNDDVAAAEAIGRQNAKVLMALGNAGITNIVDVETLESGRSEVTLSLEPGNDQACKRTLFASPDLRSIYLAQFDAAGREYGKVTASNGTEAQQAIAKLCAGA